MPQLPSRLTFLGIWITKVAFQPAAVWWAAKQQSLHPGILRGIRWNLEQQHDGIDAVVAKAWRYLMETWQHSKKASNHDWHQLKREIEREGWSDRTARIFLTITSPYLSIGPALMSKPIPPSNTKDLQFGDLVTLAVECPTVIDVATPDEWLEHVIHGLRNNLEFAVQISEEIDDMHRYHLSPLAADDSPDISRHGQRQGLSGYILTFASLFERLVNLDLRRAKQEFSTWPTDDDTVFSRLRIWAAGHRKIATPRVFGEVIMGLSDEAFWSDDHQRDLLLVLAKRWASLPVKSQQWIEKRLLDGPVRWGGEEKAAHKERKAWAIINRLQWLGDHGCAFSFDLQSKIAELRVVIPEWKSAYARHAADSREIRGGWVRTNTEHSILLREPIGSILAKARELSGRSESNSLEELDPFSGLCVERPVRAYLALARAARNGDYPEREWKTFLMSSSRQQDTPRLSRAIAERLCRSPDASLQTLLRESTWWLQKASKSLTRESAKCFDKLKSRLTDILQEESSANRSAVITTGRERDWSLLAINSPVGLLTAAILEDSRAQGNSGDNAPPPSWLAQLVRLLSLHGDSRRYAIAVISRDLGWLYHHVPGWTESNLLSILDADDNEDRDALWDGFLSNPQVANREFYTRLKPGVTAIVNGGNAVREGHFQSLAYFCVYGWIRDEQEGRWLSNAEFRELLLRGGVELRSQVLWRIQRELDDNEESGRKEWVRRANDLFHDVWPRQKVVKSPVMSARLCELLLSHGESLSGLADVVLPLLTKITRDISFHLHLPDIVNGIVQDHAETLLRLFYAVLSDEVDGWPYGTADLLDRIGESDSRLVADGRLQELKRRWHSR